MKLSKYILMILTAIAVGVFAAPGAKSDKKLRVGVIDFTAKGMAQNEALVISEMFRTSLVNTEMFDVIDRNNMGTIMKEQEFQQTGCTESTCAVQIGKMLNMQFMIYGTFMKMQDSLYISASMINVETGQIAKSAQRKVENAQKIDESVKALVEDLTGQKSKKTTSSYVKKGFGILSINSDPPDASVYVDDKFAGQTKLFKEIAVGRHSIRIVKDDYLTKEINEDVTEGETKEINLFMEKGVSLETAKKRSDEYFYSFIRNAGITVGGLALMTTGILAGNYMNNDGMTSYNNYNNAVLSSEAVLLREEYQSKFNTADMWFYVAETGIVVSLVFAVWGTFDFINHLGYKAMYEKGIEKKTLLILPTFDIATAAVGARFDLRF